MGGDYVRRSSRRVKVRGEREFIVNSDMMLRDFKVKVCSRFMVLVSFFNLVHFAADGGVQGGPIRPEPGKTCKRASNACAHFWQIM